MNRSETTATFLLGVFVGVFALTLVMTIVDSKVTAYNDAIKECEQKLPRDQHCKIIGVVKENEDIKK